MLLPCWSFYNCGFDFLYPFLTIFCYRQKDKERPKEKAKGKARNIDFFYGGIKTRTGNERKTNAGT
ncbi:hypothetical protein Hanom_Chr11g00982581 [Helianthus anomalus]